MTNFRSGGDNLNKGELTKKVAQKTGLSQKDSEKAINAVLENISDALSRNEKVQMVGFGTFETRKRSPRTGRNPATGKEMKIPATTVPAFKPGKQLKEKVK